MPRCWCQSKDVKVGFCINVDIILDWGIGTGLGNGGGIVIFDEVEIGDGDEFGDGVEL